MSSPRASQEWSPPACLAPIQRFRKLILALAVLSVLIGFNGQWRVGRDSAAYRGLGHHLATTGQYRFRDLDDVAGDQNGTRYPGMPMLLAGLERVFGRADLVPVTAIVLCALLTLWFAYKVADEIKGAHPWLPTVVVFGLAVNRQFVQHAHEILSDIPFLLCVTASLYLYPRVLGSRSVRGAVPAAGGFCVALLLGATLRPTFWIFALAVVLAVVVDALLGPPGPVGGGPTDAATAPSLSRKRAAILLAALTVATIGFFALDIRHKAHRALGGYEARVLAQLPGYFRPARLASNARTTFEHTLPEAFFGTQFGPGFVGLGREKWGVSTALSLAVLVSPLTLRGRGRLYAFFPVLSILALVVLGSVPRYFVMVMPLMFICWARLVAALAARIRDRAAANVLAACGLAIVVVPNVLGTTVFALEQHGFTTGVRRGRGWIGFHHVGFLNAYASGDWRDAYAVADLVRNNTRPSDRVIGPEATVLSFLSDRNVFGLAHVLPPRDRDDAWAHRQGLMDFKYAVFPPPGAGHSLYEDKDRVTGQLIARRILRPTRTVATAAGYSLASYEFSVPRRRHAPPRDATGTPGPLPVKSGGRSSEVNSTGATSQPSPKRRRGGRPRRANPRQ